MLRLINKTLELLLILLCPGAILLMKMGLPRTPAPFPFRGPQAPQSLASFFWEDIFRHKLNECKRDQKFSCFFFFFVHSLL